MRDVVLLGSTGSIGTQALDVIRRNLDRFRVLGLAAGGGNVELLARQALEFGVEVVGVSRATVAQDLQLAFYTVAKKNGYDAGEFTIPRIVAGPDAAVEVATWSGVATGTESDVLVLNGIDGSRAIHATLAALDAGRTLALANKESLILGGHEVLRRAKPGQLLPVDSEHSAMWQCLRAGRAEEVRRLVLTASGGAFRGRSRAELAEVTAEDALAHPTWSMGPLVTTNSATLVNKGLELIETHLLFDVSYDAIDVVVHPTSEVHSMVEYVDGSTIAQASPPDMRLPISLALGVPDRVSDAAPACDWSRPLRWEFTPLDNAAFPAVELARKAGRNAGAAPAVYNAANEACVEAFLAGQLPFLAIVDTVADVVEEYLVPGPATGSSASAASSLQEVLAADGWARVRAREIAGLPSEGTGPQRGGPSA